MVENGKREELQSKTVLLDEMDGMDDILQNLNKDREKMDKRRAEIASKKKKTKIAIVVLSVLSVVVLLALFFLL